MGNTGVPNSLVLQAFWRLKTYFSRSTFKRLICIKFNELYTLLVLETCLNMTIMEFSVFI